MSERGGQAVAASSAATAAAQSARCAGSGSAAQSPVAVSVASASGSASQSAGAVSTSTKTTAGHEGQLGGGSARAAGRTGSGSAVGSGSGSGGGSHTKSAPSSPDPKFVSASAGCVLNSDDGMYHLIVSWELANATGMALSVDNPGLVGSYGTYSWHGSQDLSDLGCYAGDRTQDIELYSVGGNGNRAKKTFHVHENHNRISPPPFAGNTNGPSTTTIPPPRRPRRPSRPETTTTVQSQ